jgi:hypothetical protein
MLEQSLVIYLEKIEQSLVMLEQSLVICLCNSLYYKELQASNILNMINIIVLIQRRSGTGRPRPPGGPGTPPPIR